jgi:mannitol/fructose-specific phosphotransferase system IIA component (Ntr-type)
MEISAYLRPGHIRLDLPNTDKWTALRTVAELLKNDARISDFEAFFQGILKRERMMSTGIGLGIAIPYTTTDAVNDLVISMGLSSQGVEFDSLDNHPVNLILLSGIPKQGFGRELHLQLLAAQARLLRHDSLRASLLRCSTPEECIEVFRLGEGTFSERRR